MPLNRLLPPAQNKAQGDMSEISNILLSTKCLCPRCGRGHIYNQGLFNLTLRDNCEACGLDLRKNDSADGPAVFLIFVLGALLVPAALMTDSILEPPLWVHGVVWGGLALGLTIGSLKPLKSVVIGLQYRHRPADWE